MILTIKQIRDLAVFSGMTVGDHFDDDDLEMELTIVEDSTMLDEETNKKTTYAKSAYFTEYPEEGSFGLGDPVELKE